MSLPNLLNVGISIWKLKQSSIGTVIYYMPVSEIGMMVFVGNKDFIVSAYTEESLEDWLVLYPSSTEIQSQDDAIAMYSSLSEINRTDEGNFIYSPTYFSAPEAWRSKGIKFTIPGNSVGINDLMISSQLRIQGADFWARSDIDGNEVEFSVIDKDNVLGYHTIYSLPPGHPLELTKFVESNFFPSGLYCGSKTATQAHPVVQGLYIRIKYTNNSANEAIMGVNYVWYVSQS
jgi:hypothetical protein